MTDVKRPRVFLDVSVAGAAAGRLTIELFVDKTPKTCENFRQLCTSTNPSLNYAQTPVHRIIDEFMIQGGDIPNGNGTGVASIYNGGKEFEDENLQWRELDERGLVCSANHGPDTNGSQFFVLLEAAPHLNGIHTCFGRLVGGDELLQRLSKVDVDADDRPKEAVVITKCGELERRTKAPVAAVAEQSNGKGLDAASDETSRESSARGRKRKSNDSAQAEKHDAPEAAARKRRQSDNVLDEGLRGRPKQRSRSRSRANSEAIEEEDNASQSDTATRHKRKRSPSPSRHMDRREPRNGSGEDDRDRRRRKSLPNQYHNERDQRQGRRGQDSYRPSGRRDDDRYGGGDRNGNWVRDGGRGGHHYDGRGPRDYHQGYRDRGPRYERRPRQNYDEGRLGPVDEGRLGGPSDDGGGDDEPAITYKGRGAMKYRER